MVIALLTQSGAIEKVLDREGWFSIKATGAVGRQYGVSLSMSQKKIERQRRSCQQPRSKANTFTTREREPS